MATETRSTPVRIDGPTRDRLRALSEKSGISITKLITLATAHYVDYVEREGVVAVPVKKVASPDPKYKSGKE